MRHRVRMPPERGPLHFLQHPAAQRRGHLCALRLGVLHAPPLQSHSPVVEISCLIFKIKIWRLGVPIMAQWVKN